MKRDFVTLQPNEAIRTRNRFETRQSWHRRLAGARENSSFTAQAKRLCHHEFLQRCHFAELLPNFKQFPPTLLLSAHCIFLILLSLSGCSSNTAANEQQTVVYVCEETKTLIEAPQQPTPAEHPETGQPTLLRALYCQKCKKWHAVPPTDVYPRDPLSYACPRHKTSMSAEGPMDALIQIGTTRRRSR